MAANIGSSADAGEDPLSLLDQNGVDILYVAPGPDTDYFPVWSNEGNRLAVNQLGQWFRVPFEGADVEPADWVQQKIGVLLMTQDPPELTEEDLSGYQSFRERPAESVTSASGVVYTLRQQGLSTALIATAPDGRESTKWFTDLAECFGLTINAEGTMISYLCPSAGAFIQRVD